MRDYSYGGSLYPTRAAAAVAAVYDWAAASGRNGLEDSRSTLGSMLVDPGHAEWPRLREWSSGVRPARSGDGEEATPLDDDTLRDAVRGALEDLRADLDRS